MKYLRETFLECIWDFAINYVKHPLHLFPDDIASRFIGKETENIWVKGID